MRHLLKFTLFLFVWGTLAGVSPSAFAKIESKTIKKINLPNQVLDITTSFDGKLIFSLTSGKIMVYSIANDRFIDQIPVSTDFNRITYSNEEHLILSAANPAALEIIKYDRIYNINIANRPFKGVADAKVNLVVFDDYQ